MLAATNRDLGQLMQQGKFREDLFYRLNVIPVVLPPLRERREDIPALAEHFLRRYSQRQGRPLHLSAEAVDKLLRYPWPGNVRELENAMERTAILAQNDSIAANDLPPHIVAGTPLGAAPSLPQALTLAEAERAHILQTLERFGWSHSRAAEALAIGRTSLWRKLKEYRIEQRLHQRGESAPYPPDSSAWVKSVADGCVDRVGTVKASPCCRPKAVQRGGALPAPAASRCAVQSDRPSRGPRWISTRPCIRLVSTRPSKDICPCSSVFAMKRRRSPTRVTLVRGMSWPSVPMVPRTSWNSCCKRNT